MRATCETMNKSYTLYIDAYTPETIPMARLAQYMQNLATLLGHETAVHFDTIKPGSTRLAAKVDHEYIPKVESHLALVKNGEGAGDALKARAEIDRLLAEDNATGFVYEDDNRSAQIIVFLGVTRPKPVSYGPFNQEGTLDGIVISIGGADETAHVQLQNGDMKYTGIETDRETARRLAKSMYEPVRIAGTGRWMRDADGNWLLKKFKMASFVTLQTDSLIDAVDKIRQIEGGEWAELDDTISALKALREGSNGLH